MGAQTAINQINSATALMQSTVIIGMCGTQRKWEGGGEEHTGPDKPTYECVRIILCGFYSLIDTRAMNLLIPEGAV